MDIQTRIDSDAELLALSGMDSWKEANVTQVTNDVLAWMFVMQSITTVVAIVALAAIASWAIRGRGLLQPRREIEGDAESDRRILRIHQP